MRRRLGALPAIGLLVALGSGCGHAVRDAADVRVELNFESAPPVMGNVPVTVKLVEEDGSPVAGADVKLEGNMNHAGMKPSFASLQEEQPGSYVGSLEFTMRGDWFVLVSATLPDGRRLQRTIDVPGVQSR